MELWQRRRPWTSSAGLQVAKHPLALPGLENGPGKGQDGSALCSAPTPPSLLPHTSRSPRCKPSQPSPRLAACPRQNLPETTGGAFGDPQTLDAVPGGDGLSHSTAPHPPPSPGEGDGLREGWGETREPLPRALRGDPRLGGAAGPRSPVPGGARRGQRRGRAGIYLRMEAGAAGSSGAPKGGPGPRRPLGGSRRRASPPQQPLRRGNPSARSPLHLPPSPASQPGARAAAAPLLVAEGGGGPAGQRLAALPSRQPASQRRPEPPPPSTPAPYPAGACPSGRPLIHLAPLPSEVTKPAWQ